MAGFVGGTGSTCGAIGTVVAVVAVVERVGGGGTLGVRVARVAGWTTDSVAWAGDLLDGWLGRAAGTGDLLLALSIVAGVTGAIVLCGSGTDDRPLAAARAAATSEVLVPVASATRVGEAEGAIECGSIDADLDLVSEPSGIFRALLTLSSSISTS